MPPAQPQGESGWRQPAVRPLSVKASSRGLIEVGLAQCRPSPGGVPGLPGTSWRLFLARWGPPGPLRRAWACFFPGLFLLYRFTLHGTHAAVRPLRGGQEVPRRHVDEGPGGPSSLPSSPPAPWLSTIRSIRLRASMLRRGFDRFDAAASSQPQMELDPIHSTSQTVRRICD